MKTKLIITFAAILVASVFFVDRIPQDLAYHLFADSRRLLSIANFWNVASNLPFLAVGGAGLWFLRSRDHPGTVDNMYPAYLIFFLGVFATGLGSSWYHLAPNNSTLVWDRLPMTIAFMALFVVVMGEHVCEKGARRLLIPLLLTGTASVFYWQYTESSGFGDLRPYALVQFLPMILIPVILLLYPARFYSRQIFWGMIVIYAFSKLFEYFDHSIFQIGALLSGHTIKHLVAAIVPALFLHGIMNRRALGPREPDRIVLAEQSL